MPAGVWVDPGSRVRLEGTLQDGTLVLADSLSAVDQLAPAPAALAADTTAAAPSLHIDRDHPRSGSAGGPPYTALPPTRARRADGAGAGLRHPQPSSLNSYYLEQTYGQLGFTGKVFGPFNIVDSSSRRATSADLSAGRPTAEAAARDRRRLPTSTTSSSSRSAPSCPFAGIAEIGGHHVWINGDYSVRVLAHELGHNLGLAHAGGLACTDAGVPAPMGDSCTADGFEYLDPFDAMGSGDIGSGQSLVRQMSMEHKLALHLLPTSAVKVIGTSGTYRIAPMETLTGTPELLRIPKFGGGNYFVEYRQPIGFFDSQGPPFANGVLIRTESPEVASNPVHPNADTALIDMHPETAEDWTDAAMDPGQVFTDRLRGITIRNVGQDASGVTLAITVPGDTLPPSAPSGLSAVASGTTAQLRWNAATDDFSVDDYVVKRDGAQVGTPVTTDFTDTGLVPGTTVSYTVAAVDAGGNIGPAAAVSLAIPDTAPPGAPPKVTAKVTKKGQVQLAWGAATDNGRVASLPDPARRQADRDRHRPRVRRQVTQARQRLDRDVLGRRGRRRRQRRARRQGQAGACRTAAQACGLASQDRGRGARTASARDGQRHGLRRHGGLPRARRARCLAPLPAERRRALQRDRAGRWHPSSCRSRCAISSAA